MRHLIRYFCLLLFTLLLFTCKKYPEGGCERRGPKNILGTWTLSLYEVNGIDSTDLINYNGDGIYKKITFLKNVSTFSVDYKGYVGTSAKFIEGNSEILFNSSFNMVYYNSNTRKYRNILVPEASSQTDCAWEIIKLNKKEFVIKAQKQNAYIIKFNK